MTDTTSANAHLASDATVASLDYVTTRIPTASGIVIGVLPRAGRLPLQDVTVHPTHLTLTGGDGFQESLGSATEPLPQDVLLQLVAAEGLVLVELDADTGKPLSSATIRA